MRRDDSRAWLHLLVDGSPICDDKRALHDFAIGCSTYNATIAEQWAELARKRMNGCTVTIEPGPCPKSAWASATLAEMQRSKT